MVQSIGLQRARVYAAERGRAAGIVAVVAGIILLLIGGFFFSTPMETVTEQRNIETISAEHNMEVSVDNSTAVYEEGETLRNQPLYVQPASSDATVKTAITAPSEAQVTATTVVRYTATAEGETTPFWTDERVLAERTGTGDVSFATTVDIASVRDRTFSVQREFGPSAAVDAQVVTIVSYDTGSYAGEFEVASAVDYPSRETYELPPAQDETRRFTEERVTRVDSSRTIGNTGISQLQGIVGVLGIFGIIGGALLIYAQPRLDAVEEEVKLSKERYNEFITTVEGPVRCPVPDDFAVSLEELVQYAISTNTQVKECSELGTFVLVGPADVIMYDPYREERERGEEPRIVEDDGELYPLGHKSISSDDENSDTTSGNDS